jgi:PAS domain S-box-containing protein
MRSFKVNNILRILIVLLILVVIGVTYLSVRQGWRFRRNTESITHTEEVMGKAEEIKLYAHEFVLAVRDYLIVSDQQYVKQIASCGQKMNQCLAELAITEKSDELQPLAIDSILSNVKSLTSLTARVDSIVKLTPESPAKKTATAEIRKQMGFLLSQISIYANRLKELEAEERKIQKAEGEQSLSRLKSLLFAVLGFIILLGLVIVRRIRTEFLRQQASEKKFLTLLEAAPDATIITDSKGVITMANKQAEVLFGYNQQELLGMEVEFLIPGEMRDRHVAMRETFHRKAGGRIMNSGKELKAVKKDRSVFPVEISLSPIETDEGRFMAAAIRDISQRKKAEEEILQLFTQVNLAAEAIYVTDDNLMIKTWNKGARDLYGFSAEEAIGKYSVDLLRTTLTDEEYQAALTDMIENDYWSGDLQRSKKNGDPVYVHSSLSAIRNEAKDITGYVSVSFDISKERKLREQVKYLASIVEQATDAIISVNEDKRIISWNSGAAKLHGFTEAEVKGRMLQELNIARLTREDEAESMQAILVHGVWTTETMLYHKDGSSFFGSITGYPLFDSHHEIRAVVFFEKDISLRKKMETQLQQYNEELETEVASRTSEIRQSEMQYRYLFENNPMPMWVFELEEFRFLDVNEMAIYKYGYSREEFLSMTLADIRPEADKERFRSFDHAWKMSSDDTNRGVWRHCKKNGEIIDVEVIAHSILFQGTKARLVMLNDVTARLKSERELVTSEKKFRALIENSTDIIALMDADRKISYRSPSAIRITGWTDEEVLKKDFLEDIVHPDDRSRVGEVYRESLLSPGVPFVTYYRSLHKNGGYIDVEGVLINLLHRNYIKSMVFNLRDVTEQKKAEQKLVAREKRFRSLIENSFDIIILLDEQFKVKYRSPSAERLTGRSDHEVNGTDPRLAVHPDDIPVINNGIKKLMTAPGSSEYALFRYQCKDNSYRWMEGYATNLLQDENVQSIVFNYRDVSERIAAEERLANREKHFRALIENSMDVITVFDEDIMLVYRSPSATKVTGLTDEEALGKDGRNNIHPDDLDAVNVVLKDLLTMPGKSLNLLFRYRCSDGHYIWAEGSATNLLQEDNIRGLVFNLRDVTGRIEAEEKIRSSEERYRHTLENMMEGVLIMGFDWKFRYVNKAMAAQFKMTKDQLIDSTPREILPGYHKSEVNLLIRRCLEERIPAQLDSNFVLPDGSDTWAQLSIQPVPEGVFILSVDITEKVRAAEDLKKQEDKLAAVAMTSPGLIYSFRMRPDGTFGFPYLSNVVNDMFGFNADEVKDNVNLIIESAVTEDQEVLMQSIMESVRDMKPWKLEFRYHHPSKGIIWLEGTSIPKREMDGGVIWHGIIMDVTERKLIQEKINEQAAQLRTLSDNLPGVMIYQVAGSTFEDRHFTYVSNEVTRLTGKTPEDIITNPLLLYGNIVEEDIPRLELAERKSYKELTIINEEVRFRSWKGEIRWLNIVSTPRKTEQGQLVWDGFHIDITDRKNAEVAIRESEERYRTLVEQAFDGILFYDQSGNILECNNSGANTLGFNREELLQMNVTDLFYAKDLEMRPLDIPQVTTGTQVFDYRSMRRKDGSPVEIELVTRMLPDGRYLAVGRDITDQAKSLSQQILLSSIVNTSDDAIISTDLNGLVTSWNTGAEQMYGYTADEMIGRDTLILLPEDIYNEELEILKRIYSGESLQHYETSRKRKDGEVLRVSITASPLVNKNGEITGISKIARDITRNKLDEDRIKMSNERYESVAKATSDAIWDFDYQTGRTFIAGSGYRDLFGYPLVNVFTEPGFWEERLHPEDKEQVLKGMDTAKLDKSVSQSSLEYRFLKADGTWAYLNDRFFIIRDQDGNPLRLLGAKQDITKQKEAEEELRKIAMEKQLLYERLSVILNTLPASVALLDSKGVMVEVNDAWKAFADVNGFSGLNYGIGDSDLINSTQTFGDDEKYGKDISAGIKEVLSGVASQFEYEYSWHLPRLKRWFRIVVTPLKGKEFNGVVVMHMDISEIRRLELERIESKIEEQKKVTEAMLKGQEKERNAIGIELHDNVNQILVGTKVLLSVVREYPEKNEELLPTCIENISLAIQENRKIAHELVTPNLSAENLLQQITRLSQTMLKNAGIKTYINHESLNENLLTDEMKLALYRVAQEQCTNIIKYASAEQVIISLATKKDILIMRIADDGQGMDPEKVTHGIGLKNISSRLGVFGGTISVDTAPDQGFALEIEIPLVPVKKTVLLN